MVRGEGALRLRLARQPRTSTASRGCSRTSSATAARDLAEAAAEPGDRRSAYFPLWTYAHPTAIELAEKLASLAPGDLNRVFFTSGGSEAVESRVEARAPVPPASRGEHDRYKVISRDIAYHGTTMGALTITSVTPYRTPFEPLVPGAIKVPNTNFYRAREHGDDPRRSRLWQRRPDRRGDPARGPRDGRRGLLGAGAERGRLLHAAAGLLPAGPRDLRPLRRAVRLRRGDLRVRPTRARGSAARSTTTCPT